MKKFSGLVVFLFASALFAQVQLGKNVQIGFGSGQGSGTVNGGAAGQFAQYGADGTAVQGATASGDCTIALGGALNCTKTNGNVFAPSATTDTTNAANISSGTLDPARMPTIFAGANGIVFNTSTKGSRNAVYSDIVPLWNSGTCSGYLKSDGTCDVPAPNLNSGLQDQVVFYPVNGTQGGPTNVQVDAATGNFLTAPNTNGTFNSDRYATGVGNNGISNLLSSADCANGCNIVRSQTSTDTENLPSALNSAQPYTHLTDNAYGQDSHSILDPGQNAGGSGLRDAHATSVLWSDPLAISNAQINSHDSRMTVATGGMYIGNKWVVAKNYLDNTYAYTRSITQEHNGNFYCMKVGDCASIYNYQYIRGGTIANNDEGDKGIVQQQIEAYPPTGTVKTGGGGQGAMTLNGSFTVAGGDLGDGFTMLDLSQSATSGLLLGTTVEPGMQPNQVTTSDSHAVSTAVASLSSPCGANVSRNAPVSTTCSVTMISGAFTANAGDIVCVADPGITGTPGFPEHAAITAVGSGTITLNLTYAHAAGVYIEQGGMCGQYLVPKSGQSTMSTTAAYPAYFVGGSQSATTMDVVVVYKAGQNGKQLVPIPSISQPISLGSITRTGNVVTATAAGGYPLNNYVAPSAAAITVAGATPSDLNGTVTGVTATPTTISWSQTGADESGSGGTITVTGFNNYATYCGAETTKVNVTLSSVGLPGPTGVVSLEANNCAWANGDSLIQPNHYANQVTALGLSSTGFTPSMAQPNNLIDGGASGVLNSGAILWNIQTSDPINAMQGYGGTIVPHTLWDIGDHIGTFFNIAPPLNGGTIFNASCPPEGCNANNYTYRLFQLASAASGGGQNGIRRMTFSPATGFFGIDNLTIGASSNFIGASGNGTKIAATSGSFINGNIRTSDTSQNAVDSGVAIGNVPLLNASSNLFTGVIAVQGALSSYPANTATTAWDVISQGDMDFIDNRGSGNGGFNWYMASSADPIIHSPIAQLSAAGNWNVASVSTSSINGVASFAPASVTVTVGPGAAVAHCVAGIVCDSSRGIIEISGGTSPGSGALATLSWSATPSTQLCFVSVEQSTVFLGIYGSHAAVSTGFDIAASQSVANQLFYVDYSCRP